MRGIFFMHVGTYLLMYIYEISDLWYRFQLLNTIKIRIWYPILIK